MNQTIKEPLILKTKSLFLFKQNAAGRFQDNQASTGTTVTITTTLPVTSLLNVARHPERPRNQFL